MGAFAIFGNTTTLPPVNWQPEPNTRSTWSVLSSSLITLALCLWTALHLNIPQHGKDPNQRWRKFGWLVVGLFAPEMVAFTAWYQHRIAVALTKKMRLILREPPTPVCYRWTCWLAAPFRSKPCLGSRHIQDAEAQAKLAGKPRNPWTAIRSFFAVMGGFAFSTDRTDPNFLPDSLTRLCLNPRGLIFLAKNAPHMLSDLPRNDILDKSKASGLAKFLVCVQAVWFCVQSINRMAQGYAISLLELNVFGQALCALFIYAFWWHKPLDIQEPTLIAQTEEAWELCALICVTNARYTKAFYNSDQDSSEIVEIYQPFAFLTPRPWHELLSGKLQFRKDEYNNTPRMRFVWNRKRIIVYGNSTSKIAEATCGTEQGSRRSTRLREGESIYGFHCQTLDSQFVYPSLWSDGAKPIWDLPHSKPTECILEPSDLRRLELCSKILRRNFLPGRNYWGSIKSLKPTAYTRIENRTSGEMRIPGAADGALGIVSLGVTIAGLAYGGLHLLAWNDPFSSRVEQILWRFSGLIIPAARPAMMVLDPTLDYLNAIEGIRREESSLLCSWGSA